MKKRILTSQIGCEESRKSTTDDTSDKCTGRGNAVNRICVDKIGGTHKKCLKPFIGTGYDCCIVAEKQAPDDGYQHNREEVEFTAFFCIIHDIND